MKLNKNDFHYWCDDILGELDGYQQPDIDTNHSPFLTPGPNVWIKKVRTDVTLHVLQLNHPQMQAVMNALRWRYRTIEEYGHE
jgi:hypothetical protein